MKVLIVQDVLKQYRLPLYTLMATELARQDIELTVAFGKPDASERTKQDNCFTEPADFYRLIPAIRIGRATFHCVRGIARYDLVIVEQANRHLLNYLLVWRRRFIDSPRVAWWGHGHQGTELGDSWRNKLKTSMLTRVDWFFAYTEKVAAYVARSGMPKEHITALNNSTDTRTLSRQVAEFRAAGCQQPGVMLFCGALYEQKRLDLLLDCAALLHQGGNLEKLIVIGAGPLHGMMKGPPWLDYRGAMFGLDKAKAYAEATLVLNPGLTGLAILDAFAAGLPYVTCDLPYHSPEVCYLEPGKNGILAPPDAGQLALQIAKLMSDPDEYEACCRAAIESSLKFSIEAMSIRFSEGIMSCLHGAMALQR